MTGRTLYQDLEYNIKTSVKISKEICNCEITDDFRKRHKSTAKTWRGVNCLCKYTTLHICTVLGHGLPTISFTFIFHKTNNIRLPQLHYSEPRHCPNPHTSPGQIPAHPPTWLTEQVLFGQLSSSEMSFSPQSLSPSQCHRLEMHFPEAHVNCSDVHVVSGGRKMMQV